MKKTPVVFATDDEGKLYVKVQAVMTPLVAMIDGLAHVYFGKEKIAYLRIDDAIEWCKKEMQHHSSDKYARMIENMEKAKAQEAARIA